MLWSVISLLVCLICILMSIAFVTLFERHLLSITQTRIGPNRTVLSGILQAVLDGLKLLSKVHLIPLHVHPLLFLMSPILGFVIMFLEWIAMPLTSDLLSFNSSVLFVFVCIGFMVYSTLLSGVASSSKYSSLGAIRASCQTVSYEVSILVIFLLLVSYHSSLSWSLFSDSPFILLIPLVPVWIIIILAETNRAPLDFAEGESELVSGFNTEYSSVTFVLLFLAEYGSILVLSFLSSVIFFQPSLTLTFIVFSIIILIRSSFPRFRYDMLMTLVWKQILPIVIIVLAISLALL